MPNSLVLKGSKCLAGYRFEIEMETVGVPATTLKKHLYASAKGKGWNVYDTNRSKRGNHRARVVSPSLTGEPGLKRALEMHSRISSTPGTGIDRKCKLLVRISWTGSPQEVLKVLSRYVRFRNDIDEWMIPSHRNDGERAVVQGLKFVSSDGSMPQEQTTALQHLAKIRKKCVHADTTGIWMTSNECGVEFRQHQGTLRADNVEVWIRFLAGFVSASRRMTEDAEIAGRTSTYKSPRQVCFPEARDIFRKAGWHLKCGGTRGWLFLRPDGSEIARLHFNWLRKFYCDNVLTTRGWPCQSAQETLAATFFEFFGDMVWMSKVALAIAEIDEVKQANAFGDYVFASVNPKIKQFLRSRALAFAEVKEELQL